MTRPEIKTIVCKQCGLKHPFLPEGTKCPMVKQVTVDGEEVDYNNFLGNIRNIVASQIDFKKIKNPKKMFAKMIVEFMKAVESYQEEDDNNEEKSE